MKSMNIQYWDAEGRRSLVFMMMGDIDPDQDTGAPDLVTVTRRELYHQPSLPPGLEQIFNYIYWDALLQ